MKNIFKYLLACGIFYNPIHNMKDDIKEQFKSQTTVTEEYDTVEYINNIEDEKKRLGIESKLGPDGEKDILKINEAASKYKFLEGKNTMKNYDDGTKVCILNKENVLKNSEYNKNVLENVKDNDEHNMFINIEYNLASTLGFLLSSSALSKKIRSKDIQKISRVNYDYNHLIWGNLFCLMLQDIVDNNKAATFIKEKKFLYKNYKEEIFLDMSMIFKTIVNCFKESRINNDNGFNRSIFMEAYKISQLNLIVKIDEDDVNLIEESIKELNKDAEATYTNLTIKNLVMKTFESVKSPQLNKEFSCCLKLFESSGFITKFEEKVYKSVIKSIDKRENIHIYDFIYHFVSSLSKFKFEDIPFLLPKFIQNAHIVIELDEMQKQYNLIETLKDLPESDKEKIDEEKNRNTADYDNDKYYFSIKSPDGKNNCYYTKRYIPSYRQIKDLNNEKYVIGPDSSIEPNEFEKITSSKDSKRHMKTIQSAFYIEGNENVNNIDEILTKVIEARKEKGIYTSEIIIGDYILYNQNYKNDNNKFHAYSKKILGYNDIDTNVLTIFKDRNDLEKVHIYSNIFTLGLIKILKNISTFTEGEADPIYFNMNVYSLGVYDDFDKDEEIILNKLQISKILSDVKLICSNNNFKKLNENNLSINKEKNNGNIYNIKYFLDGNYKNNNAYKIKLSINFLDYDNIKDKVNLSGDYADHVYTQQGGTVNNDKELDSNHSDDNEIKEDDTNNEIKKNNNDKEEKNSNGN